MIDAENITFHPTPGLSRFGVNPYGEPLYRIVFSDSRKSLVCGTWPDGTIGGQLVPRYTAQKGKWIMEKWLSPWDYCRQTREIWDMVSSALGPYPERGVYEACHVFDPVTVENSNLEKLISWLEAGKGSSMQDILDGIRATADAEAKQLAGERYDWAYDRCSAFLDRPISAPGGNRGTKGDRFTYAADEVGMPTHGGLSVGRIGR